MQSKKHIKFYLPDGLRQSAQAGQHNFLNQVRTVLCAAGFSVEYLKPDNAKPDPASFSLFHMDEPFLKKSVTIRRAYFYPFWQIERSSQRWQWDIAKAKFNPDGVEFLKAQHFYQAWQKRLFSAQLGALSQDGFVYVPLQGRLSQRRSFQMCSPLRMIEHVLTQEPIKRVVAALHPKEVYTDLELSGLEKLAVQYKRLELRMGEMEKLLPCCDYVVTQNSSVAFAGFFFGKRCVTFAKIDFHHITGDVATLGVDEAFHFVRERAVDFEKYIWWFLQKMSINAGRPEAEDKIRLRLQALGLPV
ncbi:hypothetical protein [Pseudopelagicola sp. nBUS_19]|uniref:hypothetical protein n=1 Tax=unclassified Pseudopelagicola TaxID=2649563 RepID=UPI003EBDFE43